MKSADELADEGAALQRAGSLVIVLYPGQEWMAVEQQVPFVRGARSVSGHPAEGKGSTVNRMSQSRRVTHYHQAT